MRNNALPEAEKYAKLHKRRRVWHKVVGCLACMVVFITTYMLILPAITMEKTAYCGQEEHTHSNACYETRLVCGKEETTETPHTHTDECYEEHKVLVCGKEESAGHVHDENCVQKDTVLVCTDESEEHEHTDECYQTTESYVCGKSEGEGAHTHTDDCYDTERVLICDKEESAVTPHTHTDSCYEKVMVCKKKEHTHQLSCYSNSSADVESASVWERSLSGVKLTGIWADDVISVAESQIGYKESKKNYIVTEDGKTEGYTRYGDWYGNAYGDWCAMFVSFCLNYADIPQSAIPYEASCQRWIKATSGSLYYSASDYTPQKGDLIFFDWDNDGHSDHVGLVASVSEDGSSLQTIEGNSSDAVRTLRYNTGDRNIMGYAALPENPAMAADAADENTGEAALDENAENDMAADMAGTYALMTLAEGEDETEDTVSPVNDTDNLDGNGKIPVTSISGTGTTYDAVKDVYTSELRIEFSFDKNDIVSGKTYIYTYPEGIIIPDGLLNQQKDLLDYSGMKAGTYTFVKNDDGTYAVQIQFDDSYVQNAGYTISGYVQFKGELDVSKTEDNGSIKLVGSDGVELNIPADQIAYPADETNEYDIDVSKSGSYVTDGDKLVYTVYVRSYKGTPEMIDFSDCITVRGLTLGTPTVTVEQGYRYYSSENAYYDGQEYETIKVDSTYDNKGKIQMSLPGVKQVSDTQNGQEVTKIGFYKITYTYDITCMDVTEVSPENKVTVSAKDSEKGQTVSDEATVTVNINKKHSLSKSGWYDSNTGKVKWTITVNANRANIAGAKLTDSMLGDLSSETEITFSPADGNYTVDKDEETGKITGISFKGIGDTEVNTNTYTITYSTNVEGSWDDQQIKNTANFDPTPGYDVSGDEITTGEVSVNVGGGSVAKSMDGAEIAEDGKTAEVTWTVMLTVPESGLPAGTIIEDDVTQNQWGNANTYSQWMTRGQITAWACNLYWKSETGDTTGGTNTYQVPGTSVVFKASDGNTYDYRQINENREGFAERLKYTIFTITLDKDLNPPNGSTQLYFTYKTTVDLESASIGSNSYSNSVKVGDKSAGAEYVYHKAGVKKTDGNNQTGTTSTSSDGTVTWKVVATMDDQNRKKLTLIDTLPDGVILEKLQLTGGGNLNMDLTVNEDGNISGTDSTNQYKVSGHYTENAITLDIEPRAENGTIQNNSEFTLTVTCKVNNAEDNTETLSLTNKAEMKLDDAEIGSSEQTQNWTYNTSTVGNQVVDKSGAWDNDNRRLNYSIILNPDAKDLAVDVDTLSLTDKLIYNKKQYAYDVSNNWTSYNVAIEVTIVQSTVNLYRAFQYADGTWMKGEEITGWSWNYDSQDNGNGQITNILSVSNIPDRTPLLLEYAYVVHSTAEDGDQFKLDISNTAKLENTRYKGSDNHLNDQWKEQSSSAGVTTEKNFTLYKVETGNYNNNLAGAVFSVYAYDETRGVYGETAVKTYTTDSNGMLRIQWKDVCYAYNTLYKVVETTPPSGYKLPDVVKEYYFYFSSETDTENSLPTDLPSSAVDLSKTSHTVYAENVKNTTEITVEKKWQDCDGNDAEHNNGTISVQLYQKSNTTPSTGDSGGSITDGYVSFQVTDNNDSAGCFSDFSGSYPVGTKITFQLTYKWWQYLQPECSASVNGNPLELIQTEGTETGYHNFTFTYVLKSNTTVVLTLGDNQNNNWFGTLISYELPEITDPETGNEEGDSGQTGGEGTIFGDSVELNSGNCWKHVFKDLPLSEVKNGTTVYYTYYVKESSVPNYFTDYVNNDGITEGTILVINREMDNPEITLPETGGPGTKLYTLGGMLLMACSGFLLMYNKKRRKEDMASS